jgi:hypothetical protein
MSHFRWLAIYKTDAVHAPRRKYWLFADDLPNGSTEQVARKECARARRSGSKLRARPLNGHNAQGCRNS